MDNLGFYVCEEVGSSNATSLATMVSKNADRQTDRYCQPTRSSSVTVKRWQCLIRPKTFHRSKPNPIFHSTSDGCSVCYKVKTKNTPYGLIRVTFVGWILFVYRCEEKLWTQTFIHFIDFELLASWEVAEVNLCVWWLSGIICHIYITEHVIKVWFACI